MSYRDPDLGVRTENLERRACSADERLAAIEIGNKRAARPRIFMDYLAEWIFAIGCAAIAAAPTACQMAYNTTYVLDPVGQVHQHGRFIWSDVFYPIVGVAALAGLGLGWAVAYAFRRLG